MANTDLSIVQWHLVVNRKAASTSKKARHPQGSNPSANLVERSTTYSRAGPKNHIAKIVKEAQSATKGQPKPVAISAQVLLSSACKRGRNCQRAARMAGIYGREEGSEATEARLRLLPIVLRSLARCAKPRLGGTLS